MHSKQMLFYFAVSENYFFTADVITINAVKTPQFFRDFTQTPPTRPELS